MKMKMTSLDNNYDVLADRVILFSSAVKNASHLIDLADASVWEVNNHEFYSDGVQRRFESAISISDDTPDGKSVLRDMANAMNLFFDVLGSTRRFNMDKWESYVSKYLVGGFASLHSDEGYTEDNGIYTVIMYLNGDYDGGEVVFTDYDVEVKPVAGDVLIFPSYYMHYSKPVKAGVKYMCIFRV